jgi:hypothetical protein
VLYNERQLHVRGTGREALCMGRVEGRPLGLEHRRLCVSLDGCGYQGQGWWSASPTYEGTVRQTQMWQPGWTVGRSRHARCIDLPMSAYRQDCL